MEIAPTLYKGVSGIYCLFCEVTGRIYVGKTVNLRKRLIEHRNQLRANTHTNTFLQRTWNKYGEESFDYCILTQCPVEQLPAKEAFYMDLLESGRSQNGFNLNFETEAGKVLSEETKQKLREINLGKVHTQESKDKASKAHLGVKKSPEHCANISKGKMGLKTGLPAWNRGLKSTTILTPEQKEARRIRLEKGRKDQSKPTQMFQEGQLVGEFKNWKEVVALFPDFTQSGISRSARGIYPVYKGYTFKYV